MCACISYYMQLFSLSIAIPYIYIIHVLVYLPHFIFILNKHVGTYFGPLDGMGMCFARMNGLLSNSVMHLGNKLQRLLKELQLRLSLPKWRTEMQHSTTQQLQDASRCGWQRVTSLSTIKLPELLETVTTTKMTFEFQVVPIHLLNRFVHWNFEKHVGITWSNFSLKKKTTSVSLLDSSTPAELWKRFGKKPN